MNAPHSPSTDDPGVGALSDKERETLRLILRGHDAKSMARELGLSVHTINERLRDARRKLHVSSSREAARRLLAVEGADPQKIGDNLFRDAHRGTVGAQEARLPWGRWATPRRARTLAGVTLMSLILAALLLPASPLTILSGSTPATAKAEGQSEAAAAAAARAARDWLALLDRSDWAATYRGTGRQFQSLNTLATWSDVSTQMRARFGAAVKRELIANEYVPAPPAGYQLVKFRADYANGAGLVETLSLVEEAGQWKVVGITIG